MDAFWSVFSMPIGLMIPFLPIVIAWIMTSSRDPVVRKGPYLGE